MNPVDDSQNLNSTPSAESVQPVQVQPQPQPQYQQPVNTAPTYTYAGFWMRFAAYIIDALILSPVTFMVALLGILLTAGSNSYSSRNWYDYSSANMMYDRIYSPNSSAASIGSAIFMFMLYIGLPIAIFVYFAFCESSKWQGTPGKKVLGLIVTDMNGNKLTFGRALGRNFAKYISGLTCTVGYIMAGFTEKKQTLHDMIASALVLKRV